MDLDDELRRVLSDDRLDIAVQPDAAERIVAGARRLRVRRRLAVTGSVGGLAVVAVVAGAVLFTDPRQPDALPPADQTSTVRPSSQTSGSSSAPSGTSQVTASPSAGGGTSRPDDDPATTAGTRTAPPATTGTRIGPDGFGVLRLGMSFDEAKAAGGTEGEPPQPNGGCVGGYPLLLDGEPAGEVAFGTAGIMLLAPTVDLHTAEGASTGWPAKQVQTVYPTITDEEVAAGAAGVAVPGNPDAIYRLGFTDGVLTEINLQSRAGCPS